MKKENGCSVVAKIIVRGILHDLSVQEVQQKTVAALAEILKAERCVIFKIDGDFCEIVAGIPNEEHGIGLRELLSKHPDVAQVVKGRKVLLIANPLENPLTSYFLPAIKEKAINQILYWPIKNETKQNVIGVIVVDAVGDKEKFSDKEISCCGEVCDLISLLIHGNEQVFV